MSGYLVFLDDERVKLIRVAASFEKEGNETSLFLFEYEHNFMHINWIDSIKNNFNNVIQISDGIGTEKEIYLKTNSKVKATYPKYNEK